MGIYDRDYYRREGPSFLESFSGQGRVCKYLIGVNALFLVLQIISPRFTDLFDLQVDKVLSGQVWRLLSYAFLHDLGWMHIVFNMLFLWWFGHDVEDIYGSREFLAFYLVSALLGGIAFTGWEYYSITPPLKYHTCLGASGAVTAVMMLYACHYPKRLIYIWFLIPLPIWLFVAFHVAQDFLVFSSRIDTGTAVTVHLAGAAFGFLYYRGNWRIMNWLPNLRTWQRDRKARSRFRIYNEREERPRTPVPVGAPPAVADVDEQLEAKLDAVLQKVSQQGKESLTDSEKQILLRASEVFKKRRS
jgi:membrane associated rhomboid family serine protease